MKTNAALAARWPKHAEAPPGTKWCKPCATFVPHDLFAKSASGYMGLGAYCKACSAAKNKAKYGDRDDHTISERFWKYVDKNGPNGCWQWTHTRTHRYGMIWYRGKLARAHLVSMDLHGIPRPTWPMVVDHMCHNTKCVNPAHLRVVHQNDNASIYASKLSPFFANKQKTHCTPHNHPLSGDNVHWQIIGDGRPSRLCIACMRLKRPNTTIQPNTRETARVVPKRTRN